MGFFKKNKLPKGYEQVQGSIIRMVKDEKSPHISYALVSFIAEGQRVAELCKAKPVQTYRVDEIRPGLTVIVTYEKNNPHNFYINDI